MRKLLLVFFCIPFISVAQPFHITAWGGFAGYQGDLESKRIKINQTDVAFGLGLKYDLTTHLSIRTGFNYGKIKADDKGNEPILQARNLSFQSKIIEGNLMLEYSLINSSKSLFTPYVFAGIGIFHFNPYAYDTLGNKIFLKPLSTEGQGLSQYPDRKPYKLTQFAIPFGGGLRLKVADNITIGYELGLRKLFTDYLDDVSSRYVDPVILAQAKGAKVVEMAFRGGEVKNSLAVYPAEGSIRGGAKFKDWYYFHGIIVTIGLNTGGIKNGKRGSTACPKVI